MDGLAGNHASKRPAKSLKKRKQAHESCQENAVPHDSLKNIGFPPELMGCSGGDTDALSIDHLAHDAARAIGGANQRLRLKEATLAKSSVLENLGSSDFLQTAEER